MKLNIFITTIVLAVAAVSTVSASTNTLSNQQTPSIDLTQDLNQSYEEYKRQAHISYNTYKEEAINRYLDFRDSVLLEFVKSMKKPWKSETRKPAVPRPVDNSIAPEITTIEEGKKRAAQNNNSNSEPKFQTIDMTKKPTPSASNANGANEVKIKSSVVVPNLDDIPQAEPFVPVITNPEVEPAIFNFMFYGTILSARLDDRCKFKIGSVDNDGIARTMAAIVSNDLFNYTLGDCISIREKYKLCDWAYIQMLLSLSEEFFGGATNEATLLAGYLYCMSGYKMRYAYDTNNEIRILFACDQVICGMPFISLKTDNYRNYYILNGSKDTNKDGLLVCDYSFPQEQSMSLYVKEVPLFDAEYNDFSMKLHSFPINLNYRINKNLMDFYESYPVPRTGNDLYSKWEYYARTPLSNEAKEAIYPVLRKEFEGKSELESVNIIMDWIETYKYGYDTEIWGYDRAFFPDETLFYPSSDCEDHAILFTRLVGDLLGLKTAFVYYPGHLAAAVKFTGEVAGDYIIHDNEKYTVCDPTIYYGSAGRTMKDVNNDEATIIVLQ